MGWKRVSLVDKMAIHFSGDNHVARFSFPPLFGRVGAHAMIPIREIDHLVLRVIELDSMLGFYCGALGCSVERRQDEIGLVQLRAGRSLIDLVPVVGKLGKVGGAAPGPEGRNLDHFCLRVDPFDEAAIRAHLAEHGVAAGPVESRYGAQGEGPSIYLTDPEGNVVELKGPPEG
jgi:catechol 2,3-dioxygenase-like lactoylglutathione lyase family enzyme